MRFKEGFTRDIAGAFGDAKSLDSGAFAFDEAMNFSGLGQGPNPIHVQAMKSRMREGQMRKGVARGFELARRDMGNQLQDLGIVSDTGSTLGVKDLQSMLLKAGAQKDGLVGKDGRPDGIWGSKTATQTKIIGKNLGFATVGASPSKDKRSVTVTPANYITKLRLETAPKAAAPTGDVATVVVSQLQEMLLRAGAKKTGMVKRSTGKPDGFYGAATLKALQWYTSKQQLALASVKGVGGSKNPKTVVIDPKGVWDSLSSNYGSLVNQEVEVPTDKLQASLLVTKTVTATKNNTDGKFGAATKSALVKFANNNDAYMIDARSKSGSDGKVTIVSPRALVQLLDERAQAAMAERDSRSSKKEPERTYSQAVSVKTIQDKLIARKFLKKSKDTTDGKWGKTTAAGLQSFASSIGYKDVMVATGSAHKLDGTNLVRVSPPELLEKLLKGESGRDTTTVQETSTSVLNSEVGKKNPEQKAAENPIDQSTNKPIADTKIEAENSAVTQDDEVEETDNTYLDNQEKVIENKAAPAVADEKKSKGKSKGKGKKKGTSKDSGSEITTAPSDESVEGEPTFFEKNKKLIIGGGIVAAIGIAYAASRKKRPALAGY
jgi:hypothetical protein